MELPTGQLDTLKSGAAALLDACAAIEPPSRSGGPNDSDMAMLVQGFDQLLDVMEQAFDLLTNNLPKDTGQFFTEGMQQMDALNYPEHVRAVMTKCHRQRNIDRSLH
jgi:hypothetical protein